MLEGIDPAGAFYHPPFTLPGSTEPISPFLSLPMDTSEFNSFAFDMDMVFGDLE